MQFTRLRLTGFKSFVDPTELLIAPGLTGVVGPNGCGKSNLLEALRWVMGENRASAMRGDGMEDVIFAGAVSRPARGHAEVMLSIDNADRLAPPSFNDADLIEITRRITRDAGSVYRTNGKEVRARDVQMLFADASTGAHSPSLVRQGQIAELINARPSDRRRILEEAAGISGLYQRRHEAELKLKATETNLGRVAELLAQLETQFRALERQAKQAARYREIAGELQRAEGVLLWRRWHEADVARAAAEAALIQSTREAAQATMAASACLKAREQGEAALPPLREEDAIAAALLQRLTIEMAGLAEAETRARQAIAALTAESGQLRTDREREVALGRDAAEVIAALGSEGAALEAASSGFDSRLEGAATAARAAGLSLSAAEAAADEATGDAARLAARQAAAARRLDEAIAAQTKLEGETETAVQAVGAAEAALTAAGALHETALASEAEAALAAASAAKALALAEAGRATALAEDYDMRTALSQLEGEFRALDGERAALRKLIDRDRAGVAHMLDLLKVEPGFEAALGAALGDDLKTPAIDATGRTGWAENQAKAGQALPDGAQPLGAHVQAPASMAARLAQTGLVPRQDGARLQALLAQGQRLVSREGDLWRWDGFRVHADDASSSAALRLAQVNQLSALEANCARVSRQCETARAAHEAAHARLEAAQRKEQDTRHHRRECDEAATLATRALSRAEAEAGMLGGKLEALRLTASRRSEELVAATGAVTEARAASGDGADLDQAQARADAARRSVEEARAAMLAARSAAEDLRREGEARTRRQSEIRRDLTSWTERQASAGQRMAELETRIAACETRLEAARLVPDTITTRRSTLATALEQAETRRKAASDALAVGETALRKAEAEERATERTAGEKREVRARAEAVLDATAAQMQIFADQVHAETGGSPQALLEHLGADPESLPPATTAEGDVARLRRQREALGAVNLRADEDARETGAEITRLTGEKDDLEAAVAKLRQGIAGLNREGRQRLLDAFEQVNRNFGQLFKTLFGGGEARLVLVESDDPLEAGLEIMCQPPGKKLSTLSLLSGGEQTLTALSLIFAVFRANPSPICVLDEVDAPLDDANVGRFCDLLDEMTRLTNTRFLIITHHAVTMSRMDRLFGVTMAEKGVSQLVSVDLSRAEEMVA